MTHLGSKMESSAYYYDFTAVALASACLVIELVILAYGCYANKKEKDLQERLTETKV